MFFLLLSYKEKLDTHTVHNSSTQVHSNKPSHLHIIIPSSHIEKMSSDSDSDSDFAPENGNIWL